MFPRRWCEYYYCDSLHFGISTDAYLANSACFAETGQFAKIVVYANRVNYTPDYPSLLQHITRLNPDQGAEFAGLLVNNESGPLIDIEKVR